MSESKAFSSLSPQLLARKGGAKPAMRPQLQPLSEFHEDMARQADDDLGWNDMGGQDETDEQHEKHEKHEQTVHRARDSHVVPIKALKSEPETGSEDNRLQQGIAAVRRSALSEGRRAAFTLRIDAHRHLQLRLASTVTNRSAQQLLIEALDTMLENMPDVQSLADSIRRRS